MGLFGQRPIDIKCQRCGKTYKSGASAVPICADCWDTVKSIYALLMKLEDLKTSRKEQYTKLKAKFLLSQKTVVDATANENARSLIESLRKQNDLTTEEDRLLRDVDTLLFR